MLNIRKKISVILRLRDFSFDYNNNDDYRIHNIVFYFSAAKGPLEFFPEVFFDIKKVNNFFLPHILYD